MTKQEDKPETTEGGDRTQLRPAVAEWTLTPTDPAHQGVIIPVRADMTVGREGCDITLTGDHTSRKHAKLVLAAGALRVEDLGSANGTFVNDERIETRELKPGDELRFDTERFLVDGPRPTAQSPQRTMLRPAVTKVAESTQDATPETKLAADPATAPKDPATAPKDPAATPKDPTVTPKDPVAAPTQPSVPGKGAPEPAKTKDQSDEASGGPQHDEAKRQAWYERDTADRTVMVKPGELREKFAADATQIVRGVQEVDTPSLIGASGEWSGQIMKLGLEATVIGREDTDIVLDEPSVSSTHARIVRDGERWKVVDLMSANGVYVNGKKTQVAYLSPGDSVRFGRVEMRFVIDSTDVASRSSATAAAEDDGVITGSSRASTGGSTWLYVVIGFVVVVALGAAYLLWID